MRIILVLASAMLSCACSGDKASSDAALTRTSSNPSTQSMEPQGDGRPKLWLSTVQNGTESQVTVNFRRGTNAGPRVAEVRIGHSNSVEFVESEPGSSVRNAEKELTVQVPQSGVVRLVVLSRNSGELSDGSIALLKFRHTGPESAKADILMDKPVFAPVEAMQGLLIGDPVDL